MHSSTCTYGVVPFENSTNGSVVYTLDLLIDREDLFPCITVCGEAYMDVHHCLLGRPTNQLIDDAAPLGARTPTLNIPHPHQPRTRPLKDLRHIKRIYSHPQAFGQCEAFLSTYLKGVERQDVSSTSKAAETVAADGSNSTAAISSRLAAEIHGLEVLAEGIEDSEDNVTRFLILRRDDDEEGGQHNGGFEIQEDNSRREQESRQQRYKSLLAFKIEHQASGALANALDAFRAHGLNLTSINSRPSREHAWHYVFLVEFEGRREGDGRGDVNAALGDLEVVTRSWKWLGSWVDRMRR